MNFLNSVSKKIGFFQSIIISGTLLLGVFSLDYVIEKAIIEKEINNLNQRTEDIKNSFQVLNDSIVETTKAMSKTFKVSMGELSVNKEKSITNKIETDTIYSNGTPLNNFNDNIDKFTETTGAVATVFVKHNDDFLRVATSLKKADGSRAMGTYLTKQSRAYDKIMNKQEYVGAITLFGKKYVAVYSPIIQNKEVVGILFVAYNFDSLYSTLENSLKKVVFGETGHIFVIDENEKKFVIHKYLQDKKLDELNPAAKKVTQQMLDKLNGNVRYTNSGEEILLSFVEFKEWNLIVGSKVKLDELLGLNKLISNSLIFGGLILFIILIGFGSLMIKYIINKPLEIINNGIKDSFKFINRESNKVVTIEINSNDEFGEMAKELNINISKTEKSILEDKKMIDETILALGELASGDLGQRIKTNTSNPSLFELEKVINKMSENLENNINNFLKILTEYSNHNYMNKINTSGLKNHLLYLSDNVNKLNDTITEMLVENKSNGLTLRNSSNILLQNVDKLNTSSNQAATSLEETAAALEEITSNIRNNTENIAKMAKYSSEITKSSHEGENLANKTTIAMEEINKQVRLVNDAISVIDQISFQTNILSLNARVERATAGEAGKGFAVVRQEVRNLANRSAEARKEIKNIVEIATKKANEGKQIANEMIKGYSLLNSNISQTITLISDVEMASKEQLVGIEQINDAISKLDGQTQQNANVATQTNGIAIMIDGVSNIIVQNAESKNFVGKESIVAKKIETQKTEIINKSIKNDSIINKPKQVIKENINKTDNKLSKQIVSNVEKDSDDEWESF